MYVLYNIGLGCLEKTKFRVRYINIGVSNVFFLKINSEHPVYIRRRNIHSVIIFSNYNMVS